MVTAILNACLTHLADLNYTPAVPVAWPGINFDPPSTGLWIEAKLFPNENQDVAWENEACYNAIGFFQVLVGFRPVAPGQSNEYMQASALASAIVNHFAKGTPLGGPRVLKTPSVAPVLTDDDRLYIPITIPYRGLVSPI